MFVVADTRFQRSGWVVVDVVVVAVYIPCPYLNVIVIEEKGQQENPPLSRGNNILEPKILLA